MAFVNASGITGCVTFYSGTNQYIPEVFRSTVAEYGYARANFFACFRVLYYLDVCLRMVDSCGKEEL